MKKMVLAMMLLAGGTMFAGTRVAIGFSFGAPAPVVVAARPACPGPGYVWVDGYYGANRVFVPGYWSLPPSAGAYWVAPRYVGPRFVPGYWGHGYFRAPVVRYHR